MKIKYLSEQWKKITKVKTFTVSPSVRAMIKAAPTLTAEELRDWRVRLCDREDADMWVPYMIHHREKGFPRVLYAHIGRGENILEISFSATEPNITITEWDGYKPISVKYASQNESGEKPSEEELSKFAEEFRRVMGNDDSISSGDIDMLKLLNMLKIDTLAPK